MWIVKIRKLKFIQSVRNTHRLFGFVLSVLFFMWCVTGFVMMYKEFPSISKNEYNAMRSEILQKKDGKIVQAADWDYEKLDSCRDIRIYQLLDKTIVNITDYSGEINCLDAYTGNKIIPIVENEIPTLINKYFNNRKEIKRVELITELDQWIPRTKFLPHMPIYKVTLNDADETTCYISSKSGEIIQKLSFEDKVWAWLGPIPHWIYFKTLRINTDAWRIVVIALSFLGVLLALLGIILGINRTLIARKKSQQFTPYKKKWFRWHHYLGFIFGLFVFTWILSGLLSMNPLKWASEDSLSEEQTVLWQGKDYSALTKLDSLGSHLLALINSKQITEIKLSFLDGQAYSVTLDKSNNYTPTPVLTTNISQLNNGIDFFKNKIKKLLPGSEIISNEVLKDYDDYYYNKHRTLPLPIYRFKFNDDKGTWIYVNPKTLEVVKKMQTDNKVERWLYNGLHSFDFPSLFYKRPLWDILVMTLLLGCSLLCFTGLKLTVNKLYRWYFK